jgi:uncharacterized membrane protein YfcA
LGVDSHLAIAGLIVGFVVGLTGMGGGALMTPILVLLFNVQPLAAVSSDLVASFVMKPIGGAVHLRRGTVHRGLVVWLMAGSVPAAFAGVVILRLLGNGQRVQNIVQYALGGALLLAAGIIVINVFILLRSELRGGRVPVPNLGDVPVRPLPTLAVGILGGLIVGMTSVGSGSLIIVCLLFLYPRLHASQLVGTDLIQAIPLVGAAALGHVLFGDFHLSLTASLLVGAIPGVLAGARLSAYAPNRPIRWALAFVLIASGLKLVNVGTVQLAIVMGVIAVVAPVAWWAARHVTTLRLRAIPGPAARSADA